MTSAADLARFQHVVARRLGLRLEADAAVRVLDDVTGSIAVYVDRLERDEAEQRALVAKLVVGETYFFRHREQLTAFAEVALPAMFERAEHVRVLSAGCSTGEEAYTLAMLVRERWPEHAKRVDIVGVDLNRASVEIAIRGVYSRWSLRSTPPEAERRWLHASGQKVHVDDELRRAVTFLHGSVSDPARWPASSWHIVFFRNVLMYFTEEKANETLAMAARGLVSGGFLFLGHAESTRSSELELCHSHDAFFYRKIGTPSSVPRVAHLPLPARSLPLPAALLPPVEPVPSPGLAHCEASMAREAAGDLVGAVHHAELAITASPDLALAHLALGRLAKRAGDHATARTHLDRAIALFPSARADELGGIGRAALLDLARREREAIP